MYWFDYGGGWLCVCFECVGLTWVCRHFCSGFHTELYNAFGIGIEIVNAIQQLK